MDNESLNLSNESSTPQGGWHGTKAGTSDSLRGVSFYKKPQNHFDSFNTLDSQPPSPSSEVQDSPDPVYESEKSEKKFEHLHEDGMNKTVTLAIATEHKGLRVKQGEYLPEYGPLMYEWFCSKEKYRNVFDTFVWKNGSVEEKKRSIPNPPPHFSEFARTLGVTKKKLETWSKEHVEFNEYYEACVDIIQEFIIDNGIVGNYSAQFGIFAAKNLTKMRDVVVNKNENYNMKEFLDALEKGKDINGTHDI